MTKFRLLLVSMLAVFAVGAVASTAAMAANNCTTLAGAQCLVVKELLTETIKATGTKKAGTTSKLVVAGIGTVVCTTANAIGTLDETTTGILVLKLVIAFSGSCKLEGHVACKVAEPINTKEIGGTLVIAGGVGTETFKPETPEEFATVNISGCEQEAIIKVTGSQKCKIPAIETEAATHELKCATTESSLKDGAKVAEFEVTGEFKVEGGNAFAALPELI
jgi:hypothetical protein